MHRWQLSTGNTEGLVCTRSVKAEPAASVWGSSSSEMSSNAGGVLWWVCVWFFLVFFTLWPGRIETVDSWPVIWVSPQIVLWWLGAFLSQSPEGSAFEIIWVSTCPSCWCFPALKLLLDLKRLVLAEGLTNWLMKWCVSVLLLAVPKVGLAQDCNLYCYWVFYCWSCFSVMCL